MKPIVRMYQQALEEGMAEAEKWITIENENHRPVFPLPAYVANASHCSPVKSPAKRPAPLARSAPLAAVLSKVLPLPLTVAAPASAAIRRAQLERVLEELGTFTGEMLVEWATP